MSDHAETLLQMAQDTPEDAGAAALARVEELEAALETARQQEQIHADNCRAAEADRDRLREALREAVAGWDAGDFDLQSFAREAKALAGPAPEGGAG